MAQDDRDHWSGEAFIKIAPHCLEETRQTMDSPAAHLGAGNFRLGGSSTLADAVCFNPVGFLRVAPALLPEIES